MEAKSSQVPCLGTPSWAQSQVPSTYLATALWSNILFWWNCQNAGFSIPNIWWTGCYCGFISDHYIPGWKKKQNWPSQGERIIPLRSSFLRPLQRGCEMLTNEIKCQPLCIYFLMTCNPGVCCWRHRKAKRMLAFSQGGVKSESLCRSGRWGRTGLCLFLTLPSQHWEVSFLPLCPNSPLQSPPPGQELCPTTTYLPQVTSLWDLALCLP